MSFPYLDADALRSCCFCFFAAALTSAEVSETALEAAAPVLASALDAAAPALSSATAALE